MNISDYKTLFDTLCDTVKRYPDRAAYCVPPMDGRSHNPEGWEITCKRVKTAVKVQ